MTDLASLLELEELDRDLYRGPTITGTWRPHLFGGQVAAQALRAATHTVPDGRLPHSMHGYFLRAGTVDHPVILRVFRDRDGGSFSARRVVAIQHGEAIFTVSASFHADEPSGEFQMPMPADVPPPDEFEPNALAELVEMRTVLPAVRQSAVHPPTRQWIRCPTPLPDDPVVHACALAYASDFGHGFGGTDIDGLAKGGPSLDHSVWFHRHIRLDDWVLLDLWPLRASGMRGTYMGTVHDLSGTLGCVLAQESLLRPRPELA